jgi:hypothetical protein
LLESTDADKQGDVEAQLRLLITKPVYARWGKAGKEKAIRFTQFPSEVAALLTFADRLKARLKQRFG